MKYICYSITLGNFPNLFDYLHLSVLGGDNRPGGRKMHKTISKILSHFVHFAYCNLCALVLYYNRSEGKANSVRTLLQRGKANSDRALPPSDAEKKFQKTLDKPL